MPADLPDRGTCLLPQAWKPEVGTWLEPVVEAISIAQAYRQ